MINWKRFLIVLVPLIIVAGSWGALMAWLISTIWVSLPLAGLGGFIIGVGALLLHKPWWRTLD